MKIQKRAIFTHNVQPRARNFPAAKKAFDTLSESSPLMYLYGNFITAGKGQKSCSTRANWPNAGSGISRVDGGGEVKVLCERQSRIEALFRLPFLLFLFLPADCFAA